MVHSQSQPNPFISQLSIFIIVIRSKLRLVNDDDDDEASFRAYGFIEFELNFYNSCLLRSKL